VRYLIVLLLAGCAADYVWDKPGATAQALEADQSECAKRPTGKWASRALRESMYASCMREKDWRLRLKE